MAASTLLIYIGLLFFAAYPKPLIERVEYGPVYLLFSVIVLSFYVVFISSISKTKQIYEQNLKLEKENEIYQIAYTDALTGLGNRAAYIEHINEIERSKSSQDLYCCVMLDVNRFKAINDSHGHHTGDDALKGISAALQKTFRKTGALLFCTGGDEFAIIIHNLSEAAVQEKLEAAKKEIEKAGQTLHILLSVAIGYSFLAADGKDTIENAFIRADQKMYHAKKHTIS